MPHLKLVQDLLLNGCEIVRLANELECGSRPIFDTRCGRRWMADKLHQPSTLRRGDMIKEVIAIIRLGKWAETLARLEEVGVIGFTRERVYGRGKQWGMHYEGEKHTDTGFRLLPKWMVTMVVESTKVNAVVEIIMQTNRTGEIGDGKIFICPVLDSIRIRTNENKERSLR